MKYERRSARRAEVRFPARWEGVLERREATVTSLSSSGCFLLTGGKVETGELLRIELYPLKAPRLYLWAEVVDTAFEIGFAVRFISINDQEQAKLDQLIEQTFPAEQ